MDSMVNLNMPVTVYGNLEKYNETISKARCRIFYKYENRNGTYITDEFADLLLSTVAYAPVKGIYVPVDGDYSDHGAKRNEGRIYGIVPENPNIAWEEHLDEDGTTRTYACVDVLIYTGLYKEAEQIVGSGQSMELYDKSIEGDWQIKNGKRYFVFKKGCFLGLQVLGEDVEPCFEGAAFFSLLNRAKTLLEDYENFQKQGGQIMKVYFKLSDDEKYFAIWSLLNPNYNEAGGWVLDYDICAVYDDYALVRNHAENCYERVYYTKDDATDSLVLGEKTKCFIIDVTESEKSALDLLHQLNGGTYEKANEVFTTVENLQNENSDKEQKIGELNTQLSTLNTEHEETVGQLDQAKEQAIGLNNQLVDANAALEAMRTEFAALQTERDGLVEYKNEIVLNQKKAVLASYGGKLNEEIIGAYTANIDSYVDAKTLDKELAYELVQTNPGIFAQNPVPGYYPKDDQPKGGLEAILSKYKK